MNDVEEHTDFLDLLKDKFEVLPDDRFPAIAEMESYLPKISDLSLIAHNIVIEDVPSCQEAQDKIAEIRLVQDKIESLRKKGGEPFRKTVLMINDSAGGLKEILSKSEREINIKVATYQAQEAEKSKAAQESVKELSAQLGVDIIIPEAKSIQSSKTTSFYKEELSFQIEDASLIPDIYWVVDEKAIQKHIDLGIQDIPGVKIVKSKKFVVRRK